MIGDPGERSLSGIVAAKARFKYIGKNKVIGKYRESECRQLFQDVWLWDRVMPRGRGGGDHLF